MNDMLKKLNGNVNHPADSAIQQRKCQSSSWLCHTKMEMSIIQLTLPYNNGNVIIQLTLPYNVNYSADSAIQQLTLPYNSGNFSHPTDSGIQLCKRQASSWLCHTTMSIIQLTLQHNNVNHSADSAIQQLTLPYNSGNFSHPADSAIQQWKYQSSSWLCHTTMSIIHSADSDIQSVLRIRIQDPGSGALLTLDPGSGIRNRFFPDPRSSIPNPYIWEHSENFLGKNLKILWKLAQIFFFSISKIK